MPRSISAIAHVALIALVVMALGLGVSWQPAPMPASAPSTPVAILPPGAPTPMPAPGGASQPATPTPANAGAATPAGALPTAIGPVAPPASLNKDVKIEPGDAPLIDLAPSTINVLLLGSDAAADDRYARTDSIMVASINPDIPSVSLLSFPRDLQIKMIGHDDDRINTAMEYGNVQNYPGGGVSYLAAVLRKNFGIRIDHFARIDFTGFVMAVDALGGVDVLVECELHETFPDKASPNGRLDLDFYPGKMTLNGKAALGYSRARYSTSDFDRARRQQKVIRAIMSKALHGNLLQNALPLYGTFRQNIQTDVGVTDLPAFVDIARRMNDLSMKSRVLSFPAVKNFTRKDGASVLIPADDIRSYVIEALTPPITDRASTLPRVELVNATGKPDMGLVAAERLVMEGFNVVSMTVAAKQSTTSIVNYAVTPKGSPVARLQQIFSVLNKNVDAQPDPSSIAAAQLILGANYDSCPNTYQQSGGVTIETDPKKLIPTPTRVVKN